MMWFPCLIWASLAHAAPWSVDAAGRLTAVGWTPSAQGGGVDLGAAAQVAGNERVRLAVGPRLTIDHTALLGTPVAALASVEVLGRPSRSVWLDGRLTAGVETTWLPSGWTVEGGELAPAPSRPAMPAARVGLSVGIGPSVSVHDTTVRPYVRYEQAVILGFAPEAGVPIMTRASVAVGVAFDLPTRSPR